jgi:hypothetical protein
MKVAEIKSRAKDLGIKPGKMKKGELIRTIQSSEGNIACFESGNTACDQFDCLWRADCLGA